MATAKSPKAQAAWAVRPLCVHGQPAHGHRGDGRVHSIGTGHAYESALRGVVAFIKERDGILGDLKDLDRDTAVAYLLQRSEAVLQKTLDLDRQAMQAFMNSRAGGEGHSRLPVIKSEHETILCSRAYTPIQVTLVARAQTIRHALATEVARDAGLRAHELLTLRRLEERPISDHREFRNDLFTGRHHVRRYTVKGKGGLIRQVALDRMLGERLESRRLDDARIVYDREIRYQQFYDIGGGKLWTDSFRKAAERTLGWSTGAHGLRHAFAQARMNTLQGLGYTYTEALAIVSQEMGHFRPNITEVYLR